MVNIKHSSESINHYTPPKYAESIRKVLGGIDFDPCSSKVANEIIKANMYVSSNGLNIDWKNYSIYCNPPGGKTMNRSNQSIWFRKMLFEWKQHNFEHGIFMAFNNSILRTDPESYVEFPFVVPSQRIRFWNREKDLIEQAKNNKSFDYVNHFAKCEKNNDFVCTPLGKIYPSPSPSHDNVIIYFPKQGLGCNQGIASFVEEFDQYGKVRA